MTHLSYYSIQLWHGKKSKYKNNTKTGNGPQLSQNWRFISFSFTTVTLLVKYILRIFQTHCGKVRVPPVGQFGFRVRHSMKIKDHVVLNLNKTIFMGTVFSDTREASDATWHSCFS
jgi:hypothetical protein